MARRLREETLNQVKLFPLRPRHSWEAADDEDAAAVEMGLRRWTCRKCGLIRVVSGFIPGKWPTYRYLHPNAAAERSYAAPCAPPEVPHVQ